MNTILHTSNKKLACFQSQTQCNNHRPITKATVFGYIRKYIELTKIIPEEIMYICYSYYCHDFISSTILNGAERDKLFHLLLTMQPHLIPGTTRNIFNASIHGFDAKSFYSKCNGVQNTILVIKSNWGSIFGAFTRIPWRYDGGYRAETNAQDTFLFSLGVQSKIFQIKERDLEYAVFHGGNGARDLDSDLIFYFGAAAGLLLYEHCNEREDNFAYGGSKCGYHIAKGNMLCGGHTVNMHYDDKYEFRVDNFELFTVDLDNEANN